MVHGKRLRMQRVSHWHGRCWRIWCVKRVYCHIFDVLQLQYTHGLHSLPLPFSSSYMPINPSKLSKRYDLMAITWCRFFQYHGLLWVKQAHSQCHKHNHSTHHTYLYGKSGETNAVPKRERLIDAADILTIQWFLLICEAWSGCKDAEPICEPAVMTALASFNNT